MECHFGRNSAISLTSLVNYITYMHEHRLPVTKLQVMGLLPDTENCGLRMSQECRERFPRHKVSKEIVS